jgi:hypothetical protein
VDAEKTVKELESRIGLLEDMQEIRELKARYAQITDGFLDEEPELLFTEDGILDLTPRGVFTGREKIRKFFKEKLPISQPFGIHYFMLPSIKIEGEKAQARWYMWLPATKSDGGAIWTAGYEDDSYLKVGGKWLISQVKLTRCFRTPYEEGWHKKRFAD